MDHSQRMLMLDLGHRCQVRLGTFENTGRGRLRSASFHAGLTYQALHSLDEPCDTGMALSPCQALTSGAS